MTPKDVSLQLREFWWQASKLISGVLSGQVITILFLPILSRIYAPDAFGGLMTFVAIVASLGVVSNLRYQLAIVQPEDDRDGFLLTQFSIICAAVFCILISLTLLIWATLQEFILRFLSFETLWLLPLGVLGVGCHQALTYWNIRKENYKLVAWSKVAQAAVLVGAQIFLGFFEGSSRSLVIGYLLSQFTLVLALCRGVENFNIMSRLGNGRLRSLLFEYRRYATLSAPAALADTVGSHLPLLTISRLFDKTITGAFGFAFQVLSFPSSLASTAVSQILLKFSASPERWNGADLFRFVFLIALFLTLFYSPVVLLVGAYGEELFKVIFGDQWGAAGRYAEILVWATFIRFIVSPLSAILTLKENIKIGAGWQVLYCLTLSVTIFIFYSSALEEFLVIFVIHELVLFGLYLMLILVASSSIKTSR